MKNQILQGDCIEVMKGLEANSIDTIICDPPYGLEFMGKDWDKFKKGNVITSPQGAYESKKGFKKMVRMPDNPETLNAYQKWTQQWAVEALRVAKPGATLLSFGGTRTYHRMACAIEDAGWILKDCIMWLYGSGFPKATDISKQLDKKAGKKGKAIGQYEFPDKHKRSDKRKWNQTFNQSIEKKAHPDILEPATPEAKLWNGWKSHGLKPAYEPIIVAVKKNDGTYANNALKWGVSGLNIDGGRIESGTEHFRGKVNCEITKESGEFKSKSGFSGKDKVIQATDSPLGRFPANIILDEEAARMLDEQSGVSKSGLRPPTFKPKYTGTDEDSNAMKTSSTIDTTMRGHNDKGGASRFFYVAKASKSERNMGCEGLEEKDGLGQQIEKIGGTSAIGNHNPVCQNCGGSKIDRGNGICECKNPNWRAINKSTKNNHPTVKPLKLMEYLCTLTKTPTGGIVLDPFAGSGTTGLACQNTGRDFILIEKEPEYIKIAEARLKFNSKQEKLL